MRKPCTIAFFCALPLALSGAVDAAGLAVKPGLWRATTTFESSIGGAQTSTDETCLEDSEISPEDMLDGVPLDACDFSHDVDGDTLSYTLRCDEDGTVMTGRGTMQIRGEQMRSELSISGSVEGQEIEMSIRAEGRYVGDC